MGKRRYRIAAAALALVIAFAFGGCAWADFWTDDGNYDTSWYNDSDTTFTLTTARQLAGMAYIMHPDKNASFNNEMFEGKTILIGADIDISAHEWRPMGCWVFGGQQIYFKGIFDGQGHRITGLNISTLKTTAASKLNSGGLGFFAEPGKGYVAGQPFAEVRNLYIEGRVVPDTTAVPPGLSSTGAWQYTGILAGTSVNLKTINLVCSGDVETNATDRGYASTYIPNQYGGDARNVVTYGTAKAAGSVSTTYAGGLTAYGSNQSSVLPVSGPSKFTYCVSLCSSVLKTGGVGAGIVMGMVASTVENCAFLTGGPNQPTTGGSGFVSASATGITNENEVPVTAVMLPAPRKYASNADVEIALSLYPATSDASKVTTKWTFDEPEVTVKSSANGVATVSSTTNGVKHFTVVVGGLNGFEASETVTLKGTAEFTTPATAIDVSPKSLALNPGGTRRLVATLTPTTAPDDPKWDSNNTSVARVDETGLVTAVSPGYATITATSAAGHKSSCTVTVESRKPTPDPSESPAPGPTDDPTPPAPTDEPAPGPTDEPAPGPTDEPAPGPTDGPAPTPSESPVIPKDVTDEDKRDIIADTGLDEGAKVESVSLNVNARVETSTTSTTVQTVLGGEAGRNVSSMVLTKTDLTVSAMVFDLALDIKGDAKTVAGDPVTPPRTVADAARGFNFYVAFGGVKVDLFALFRGLLESVFKVDALTASRLAALAAGGTSVGIKPEVVLVSDKGATIPGDRDWASADGKFAIKLSEDMSKLYLYDTTGEAVITTALTAKSSDGPSEPSGPSGSGGGGSSGCDTGVGLFAVALFGAAAARGRKK